MDRGDREKRQPRTVPAKRIAHTGRTVPAKIIQTKTLYDLLHPRNATGRVGNKIILQNGPTRVTIHAKTGHILRIENTVTKQVLARYDVRPVRSGHRDSEDSAKGHPVFHFADGHDYPAAFLLYLFWRHFGLGHEGCVLKPRVYKIAETRAFIAQDHSQTTIEWDIDGLENVWWTRIGAELSTVAKGGYYYEEKNGEKVFEADGSPDVPTAIAFDHGRFLRARVTTTIDPDGTLRWGDFSVKLLAKPTEDEGEEKKASAGVAPKPAGRRLVSLNPLDLAVHAFQYPFVDGIPEPLPQDGSKNFLVFPHMEGKLLRNPHKRLLEPDDEFPNGVRALRLLYPYSYEGSMQFLALFAEGKDAGLYIATHDESMKAKVFIFEAVPASSDRAPRVFNLSLMHWNDNLCRDLKRKQRERSRGTRKRSDTDGDAVPDLLHSPIEFDVGLLRYQAIAPGEPVEDEGDRAADAYEEYVPEWLDYKQEDYWLVWREYEKSGEVMTWHDAADEYKKWARRGPVGPPWALTPRKWRGHEDFYRYAGYAVWLLGSEFNLAPPLSPKWNYLRAFHEILRSDGIPGDPGHARVLFIMGWDWHSPFGVRLDDGVQYGNKADYWKAHFGPPDDMAQNVREIRNNGDLIVPYIFALRMKYAPVRFNWAGWKHHDVNDDGSPWANKRYIPGNTDKRTAHSICPATTAYSEFVSNRDRIIRDGNFEDPNIPPIPLDGVYHDVGVTFNPVRCLFCHRPNPPEGHTIDELHDHFTAENEDGFQVGTGGFLNRAKRAVLNRNLYGTENPSPRARRRELFGSEGTCEPFIDLLDCHAHMATWGPYKQYTIAASTIGNVHYPPAFTGWIRWVYERTCEEIPLLQYVYNSVMSVRLAGHGNLSGGSGPNGEESAHNIGSAFFWLMAQTYLSGMIPRLDYDIVPVDVLSSMDKKADTWMLGWNRYFQHPGRVPFRPQDEFGNPAPGRHPYGRHPEFDATNRTYGDPTKEQYIRMWSYLRSYQLHDFLVYGDMIHPGTIPAQQNQPVNLDYDYYFAFGGAAKKRARNQQGNIVLELKTVRPDETEHAGTWAVRPLLTSGWVQTSQFHGSDGWPSLYLIANVGDGRQACLYQITTRRYRGPVQCHILRCRPAEESSWCDWVAGPILWPEDGVLRHVFRFAKFHRHEVIAVRLKTVQQENQEQESTP